MTLDSTLLERLADKLGLSRSQVYRRISDRARDLVVSREEAAIALALESKVSVPSRLLTPEVLATIRAAAANKAPEPAPVSRPELPRRRAATPKPSARKRVGTRKVKKKNPRRVLVVHGRDDARRKSMFRFLRAIGLEPIEWSQAVKATGKAAPYIGEVLDRAFDDAAAVVVMLTPDDQARLRAEFRNRKDQPYESTLTGQARPNVLFEAGMAFGRHPDSTVLVEVGDLRPFSDIGGRHVVHLDNHAESRRDLANRLEAAGCEISLDGSDWLSEGEFGS